MEIYELHDTRFKHLLEKDDFVVTCEIGAPRGADSSLLIERIEIVKEYCDAINIPDNALGVPAMSSTICAQFVLQSGAIPILHLTTRDRNQIAIQSELYGAYALGVRNILFMAGDHVKYGSHFFARMVSELDTVKALALTKHLSTGIDSVGEELEGAPDFYLGATVNPNTRKLNSEVRRMKKKRDAGAQFFQTQAIFDPEQLEGFMNRIDSEINILAGIIPLRDSEMARFMNEYVPGIQVPDDYIRRLDDAGKGLDEEEARLEAMKAEGIQIALETVDVVREIGGVNGLHLMGVGWPESIVELARKANLHPRPNLKW